MNLLKIEAVINSGYPDDIKRIEIIKLIALDDQALPMALKILEEERKENDKVMSRMNLLLAKLDLCTDEPSLLKSSNIQKEITDFYIENKDKKNVGHCFKNVFNS